MKKVVKRKLKKKWRFASLTIVLIVIFFAAFLYADSKVYFELIGLENKKIAVNTKYTEEGIVGYRIGLAIGENKYQIKTNTNLDTSKIGTYNIDYNITYKNKEFTLKRQITVVDEEAPIIETNIEKIEKDYCTNKEKVKLEFSSIDNYDGDITNSVKKVEENNNLILTSIDSSGNENKKVLPVTYTNKPSTEEKITLKGAKYVYIAKNGKYQEKGATITGGCTNNSNRVVISGTIDTSTVGEYTLKYSVQNNESVSTTRNIIVYEPNISSNQNRDSQKTIYLTFDDGPCAYTPKVLNTLKKYNVKATFFVTNQFPSYVHLIKDEYEQGHAVGVHTYSHNYNIYTSIETYKQDFNKMNDVIEKYTGQRSKIFRFPGGSSNTISMNYSIGIMRALATKMSEEGYAYFDWDVSSGDASSASSEKIFKNIIKGTASCSKCVVLMHDIKYNTVNILDDVLADLTSKGYKFGTLNVDSPTNHHGISN